MFYDEICASGAKTRRLKYAVTAETLMHHGAQHELHLNFGCPSRVLPQNQLVTHVAYSSEDARQILAVSEPSGERILYVTDSATFTLDHELKQ